MNARKMMNEEILVLQKEAAIEQTVMALARANWKRLSKLDPAEMILAAIELGMRHREV